MHHPDSHTNVEYELRELLERLPLPALLTACDEPTTIVLANAAFVRTFGHTLADVPTFRNWAERAYPDERCRHRLCAAWDVAVAKARATSGRVEAVESRVTCRDGSCRDVVSGAAVTGGFLMVTFVDLSDRKRAEAKLRDMRAAHERTASELTENIPVGTYTMVQPPDGGIGRFAFMSRRFLDFCGLDAEESRRDPFRAFACVHPDDYVEWVRRNAEAFAMQRPFAGECRVVVAGEVRWISAESNPRPLPDGSTVWEGVLIDITRQKEAEAALAEVREEERRRGEAQRRELEEKLRTSLSAAAVAHEIKQPLGRMLLETQMAIERLRGAPLRRAHAEDYLADMLAESRHVADMLGRMKSLLRNVQSEHAPVALAEIVASALLFSRPLLAEHGIELRTAGVDRCVQIQGDAVQLQTAVNNLIRNAAEAVVHVPSRHRTISVELVVNEDRAEIIVGDSGPGMSPEQIAAAPFTTSKPDGSGLGLYLVRTCMENHGGSVRIRRAALGGAEVSLILPASPGPGSR